MKKGISQKLNTLTQNEIEKVSGGLVSKQHFVVTHYDERNILPRLPPIGNPKGPSN
ncbi:hypothetical protein [Salinimonas chungwhensis]|uniref:hypothetical protein n=1 Tax=Salinimonas chungwhensis TaxID=265425 RepID=UPI000376B20E|nr:hypothetical protein [Salinimonas chungwhensis]